MTWAARIAAVVLALVPAVAKTDTKVITGHPSKADIAAVADSFKRAMDQGGMQITTGAIQVCYDLPDNTPQQRTLCVLWDAAAMSLDAAQRRTVMARGLPDPGPTTPFLSSQAYMARAGSYGVLLFGTRSGAQQQYLGSAPGQVLELMAR